MKKIMTSFFVLLFAFTVFADGDSLWTRSASAGNLPAWFSPTGSTERGFAFGTVGGNDRVYVASRNGGTSVRIINANTGSDVGTLDVTGIAGGTFAINDIGVSSDGIIYAGNLAIGGAASFKVYRWTNEAATPTVAFDGAVTGVNKRLGDKFWVNGSTSDNSVKIFAADPTGQKVFRFGTSDNGATFVVEDSVLLPASTLGATPHVVFDGSRYYLNSNGKNITVWSNTWTQIGSISGGLVSTGSNALTTFMEGGLTYLTSFAYGSGNENGRMLDLNGNTLGQSRIYSVTGSLGNNSNGNGTGDVDIRDNGDGTYTLFVLSTNNGFGAYKIDFPPTVNGRFNEPYTLAGSKLNTNFGFGPAMDVSGLWFYQKDNILYIAVTGDLDITNNNGIGLFFGMSNLNGTGFPSGTPLGGVAGGGHFLGNTGNNNWTLDFEAHYAFAMNPGGDDTLVYVDAVKYNTGGNVASYLGAARQDGLATTGPGSSGVFNTNAVTFAFDTAAGINRGFEIAIPLTELGSTLSDNISMFAVVVSSTAFFSDVTVPGNVTGGNPGFNTDFNSLAGGPYFTNPQVIPVELVSFAATPSGNTVKLSWETATEINNQGFSVERSMDNKTFSEITFVNGIGTSTESVSYSYTDENLVAGKYYYRLKQVDLDGSYEYSNVVEVNVLINPNAFELVQNYPNPFNPSTTIKFSLGKNDPATLKIFNAIGQEVATLFNGAIEAGRVYEIQFNASDFTSGVYFYQLRQGERVETKKMILMK